MHRFVIHHICFAFDCVRTAYALRKRLRIDWFQNMFQTISNYAFVTFFSFSASNRAKTHLPGVPWRRHCVDLSCKGRALVIHTTDDNAEFRNLGTSGSRHIRHCTSVWPEISRTNPPFRQKTPKLSSIRFAFFAKDPRKSEKMDRWTSSYKEIE